MTVQINYKSTKLKKNSSNIVLFVNEKFDISGLKKYISNKEYYFVSDLIKTKDLSKKIREIHYDKKSKKAIYGTTTPEEKEELIDEGIDLISIPWVDKDN